MMVIDTAAALAKPAPRSWKVILIPWDPNSADHVRRLYDQRVACGWKAHLVEDSWRELQRQGKMAIHWVVLSPDDPQKENKLQAHMSSYPNEAGNLVDTASALGGSARKTRPSPQPFIPVGHISLDSYSSDPELADPQRGIYYISTLYISNALQGSGLGRAAMDAVESMAVEPPLCAKALALDTLAREQAVDIEFWKKSQTPPPKICNEDWYARRGYKVVKHDDCGYVEVNPQGKYETFRAVYMKKTIV